MSAFTPAELDFLTGERRLARLATVGADGTPHVVPVGWSYNGDQDSIDVGGHDLERTKKFRDVRRHGRAAIVIDDVLPPWRPRGVEVRGGAEAIDGPRPLIRIHAQRIVSWGIESDAIGVRHAHGGRPPPTRSRPCFVRPARSDRRIRRDIPEILRGLSNRYAADAVARSGESDRPVLIARGGPILAARTGS